MLRTEEHRLEQGRKEESRERIESSAHGKDEIWDVLEAWEDHLATEEQ